MATQLSLGLAPAHVRLDAFHRDMALLRAVEEATARLVLEGACAAAPTTHGTEAALAGLAVALHERDWVLPGPRQSAIALLRGASLVAWYAQVLGRSSDPARGRQAPGLGSFRSLRVVSPSTLPGSHLPIAAGVGRAMKLAGRGEVAVAACGHGSVATDRFHVALNFAAVARAPVVFAVITQGDLSRATASKDVAVKARAYGLRPASVDGADPVAVEAALRDAVEVARSGGGPSLVDITCPAASTGPRLVGATTPSPESDPIVRAERALLERKAATADALMQRHEDARLRVAAAVETALELSPPDASLLFDDVFARATPALRSQRQEWLADCAFRELEE